MQTIKVKIYPAILLIKATKATFILQKTIKYTFLMQFS